jgi:hypothetical protein
VTPFQALDLGISGCPEELSLDGVPFRVMRTGGRIAPLEYGLPVVVGGKASALFFLGMTTQARSGECGWSGERFYGFQRKLYIGDVLGRIHILYAGNVMDAIPLIFGVNVWNYETFSWVHPHEGPVFPIGGPYREPLDGDPRARALFADALVLHDNEAGEKYTRYGFGLRLRGRPVERLWVRRWGAREAGIGISAITACRDHQALERLAGWRLTDQRYYLQKAYFPAMDRLARRLYQFLDELPQHFPVEVPAGYHGPELALTGTREAELLTNLYYHNIHDMAAHKVTDDGRMHASTRDHPCYGFYEGIGTFRQDGHYNYAGQVWSRDLGRLICELIEHGERERCVRAADVFFRYLYDPSPVYRRPHWKRIANASELGVFPENYDGITFQEFVQGRENDGHASVMLMLYRLYQHRCVDVDYLRAHRRELVDAAEWFCWQMDSPADSGFDGVLCSESEASNGEYGGYDLFSNSYAYYALRAFSELARVMSEPGLEERWLAYAERLWAGIEDMFVTTHPRHGRVLCEPESDNWPSELKRMASLLLIPEYSGYDPAEEAPEWYELWANTLLAQREVFFSPMVGGAMGYGQGYTTQTVLLLDQVEDYTQCLHWAARFSYHHSEYPYIVPEGVTYHPSGRFWYRHTDLGNAIQQTEIVKCVRLVLGLDDLNHDLGLRLVPRLPNGWSEVAVRDYPVVTRCGQQVQPVQVTWRYRRTGDGYMAEFECDRPVHIGTLRWGPFPPGTTDVRLEGVAGPARIEQRGSAVWAYASIDRDVQVAQLAAWSPTRAGDRAVKSIA